MDLGEQQISAERQSAEHQDRSRQAAAAAATARSTDAKQPESASDHLGSTWLGAARQHPHTLAPRLDQFERRTDRRFAAAETKADDRQGFSAGALALAAWRGR